MDVLIACEYSGTVRDAFLKAGHNAVSCDLLPTDVPGPHIQGDCIDAISSQRWCLIIMHPPCTALAVSGNAWYGSGMPKNAERVEAIQWTLDLWAWACVHGERVCMENPVGVLPIKATQCIQPYEFGHDASKKTCLWLHNLPNLIPTQYVEPRIIDGRSRWANQTDSGQNKLPPSQDRWKIRSTTYQGIADAMAAQWSKL